WTVVRLLVSLTIAVVVAGLPFVVFANVSLVNHLGILQVAARHGFDPQGFMEVVSWGVVAVVPLILLIWFGWVQDAEKPRLCLQEQRLPLLALLASFLVMLIPASKYGAGSYHLNPFLPSLAYVGAMLARGLDLYWEPKRAGMLIVAAGYSWLLC